MPALGAASGPPGTAAVGIRHPFCGELELIADAGPDGVVPTALFCENETNVARLFGSEPVTPYPKDGINDHVVSGATTVNPERTGTKCAKWEYPWFWSRPDTGLLNFTKRLIRLRRTHPVFCRNRFLAGA